MRLVAQRPRPHTHGPFLVAKGIHLLRRSDTGFSAPVALPAASPQAAAAHEQRPDFWQRHSSLTIDEAKHPLGNSAPEIDLEAVSWTNDVVGADRKIDRNRLWVI